MYTYITLIYVLVKRAALMAVKSGPDKEEQDMDVYREKHRIGCGLKVCNGESTGG